MTIIELFLTMYVTDFTAPEREELEMKVKEIQRCNEMVEPDEHCMNSIQKYLHMKENIGRGYGDIQ